MKFTFILRKVSNKNVLCNAFKSLEIFGKKNSRQVAAVFHSDSSVVLLIYVIVQKRVVRFYFGFGTFATQRHFANAGVGRVVAGA